MDSQRRREIAVLVQGGDEDVIAQVQSEIFLSRTGPDMEAIERHADEVLERIAPAAKAAPLPEEELRRLEEDAGF